MIFPGLKQLLCLVSASNVCSQHLQQYFRYKPQLLSEGGLCDNNSRLWSSYYPGAAINRSNTVHAGMYLSTSLGSHIVQHGK